MSFFKKSGFFFSFIFFLFLACSKAQDQSVQTQAIEQNLLPQEERVISIFNRAAPSVVFIKNATLALDWFSDSVYEISQGAGSGFVWDKRGHIVTNFHVIARADKIHVTLSDKKVYDAQVVGIAPEYDLAVLQINAPNIIPIEIGTSKNLQVGQTVLAIGNPFGFDHSLTMGIVSALGRTMDAFGGRKIKDVIQTDAAINPGNSGGPMLDSSGKLIGVSAAIYSPSGAYAGIGFSIPVDTVKRIVPQLIKYGKVKRIGLGISLVPDNVRQRLGIESGAMILEVARGSAADKANFVPTQRNVYGDLIYGDILLQIDEKAITENSDFFDALEFKQAGEKIKVEFLRGNKKQTTTVVLEEL